ncbi:MAG TPA: SpoIIE family protein phosphatase [Firmicutes bacterium]|nr:SpoIIE family protein phosphatase [Bacillota bacterium]HHY97339.1 SpoIIE family protein phosphatase [Bacillota bacterium]
MSLFIEVSQFSLCKYGEELSGDSVHVARTPDSTIVAMADGLGSGVKANILSTLTTRIAVTMLKGGADLSDVVETMGNTLPICQVRKIAYSTFTIIQILNTGQAYLAEFDNPPTFILREGSLMMLDFEEREISGKKIRESEFRVLEGDVIVVVSDGVIHAGVGGVMNLGWQWQNVGQYLQEIYREGMSAGAISERLCRVSQHLYGGCPGDDATGVVLKVRRPRSVTVLVGPPKDKKDDPVVTRELFSEQGKRVICGGTTSLLVAREIGKTLQVDMKAISPDLPPPGSLDGVDLVTEGIITLSKVVEIIQNAENAPRTRRNAAEELAAILLESDSIKFLVGTAINRAHQNPSLPPGLALKMQVVYRLARLLEERGKQVKLKFY